MQPIIWKVDFKDGSSALEFDGNGKETVFTEIIDRKSDFTYIGLIDQVNKLVYSINLQNGELILNGLPVDVGKEVDGRTYNFTYLPGVKYAEGVIQYKCSNPITAGINCTASAATYNIGYKVEIPDFKFTRNNKGVINEYQVLWFQPMICVNAKTFRVSVTTTLTIKIKDNNSNFETVVRL